MFACKKMGNITTKKELNEILDIERGIYSQYMFPTRMRRIMACLKKEPAYVIMVWQSFSRKVDYYKYRIDNNGTFIDKLLYFYNICRRNRIQNKLGLEIGTENCGKGLLVYHFAGGCVVNGESIIGCNCHLHGNNCIGNAGPHDLRCPVIGDNVMLGVGAKVIGAVTIASNVKIAAGAVVVKDILESGCTVAGVPAKKVNRK